MQQIFMDLEYRWMTAWKNKDAKTAASILADEFTLASSLSGGTLVNKTGWLDKAMHHYHCREFRIDKMEARLYGDVAILQIWFHQQATANGKDWSGNFLLTDCWVRKEKDWQVVSRHASWLKTTSS